MVGLRQRSAGCRESAAVLAGSIDDRALKAKSIAFFDSEASSRRHLVISESTKYRLYDELSQERLSIVATVHTHPEMWVGLSEADAENQLCSRVGVWAVIVPDFAAAIGRPPSGLGVHIRMPVGWLSLNSQEIRCFLRIEDD